MLLLKFLNLIVVTKLIAKPKNYEYIIFSFCFFKKLFFFLEIVFLNNWWYSLTDFDIGEEQNLVETISWLLRALD